MYITIFEDDETTKTTKTSFIRKENSILVYLEINCGNRPSSTRLTIKDVVKCVFSNIGIAVYFPYKEIAKSTSYEQQKGHQTRNLMWGAVQGYLVFLGKENNASLGIFLPFVYKEEKLFQQ